MNRSQTQPPLSGYMLKRARARKERLLKEVGFTGGPPSKLTLKDQEGRRKFVTPTGHVYSLSIDVAEAEKLKKKVSEAVQAYNAGETDPPVQSLPVYALGQDAREQVLRYQDDANEQAKRRCSERTCGGAGTLVRSNLCVKTEISVAYSTFVPSCEPQNVSNSLSSVLFTTTMMNEGFMNLLILFLIVLTQASILHARPGPPEDDKERPSHHHQELEGMTFCSHGCKKWTSGAPTATKAPIAFPHRPHHLAIALTSLRPASCRHDQGRQSMTMKGHLAIFMSLESNQGVGRLSVPSTSSGHSSHHKSAVVHEEEHGQPLPPSTIREHANFEGKLPQERDSAATQNKARILGHLVHEVHRYYHYFIFPSGSWRALPATLAERYRDQVDILISQLRGVSEKEDLNEIRTFTASLRSKHPLEVQRAWELQQHEKEQAKKEKEQARKEKEQAKKEKKQTFRSRSFKNQKKARRQEVEQNRSTLANPLPGRSEKDPEGASELHIEKHAQTQPDSGPHAVTDTKEAHPTEQEDKLMDTDASMLKPFLREKRYNLYQLYRPGEWMHRPGPPPIELVEKAEFLGGLAHENSGDRHYFFDKEGHYRTCLESYFKENEASLLACLKKIRSLALTGQEKLEKIKWSLGTAETIQERRIGKRMGRNLKKLGFMEGPPSRLTLKDQKGRKHFVTPTGHDYSLPIDVAEADTFKEKVSEAVQAYHGGETDSQLERRLRTISQNYRERVLGKTKKRKRREGNAEHPASHPTGLSQSIAQPQSSPIQS
ncbi:hypothetical protein FA10DRAFT_290817 [Acaromyces ingoldii]|uniref:Uncharacterized protein n=1 Tax=Acaromyces ingoldii TaxID=215250 RepID=A0A316YY35_9BASI|nr:hypothetical protein FA10DRAFT_290817 [Acaromyces ingoldii]PWN93664.1 hypothetical protein FA10DRAFT_290817 [Acaromyces ingoldii]